MILLVLIVVNVYFYNSPADIDYSQLIQEDRIYAESLIDGIKPMYLNTSRKIVFTTNFTYVDKNNNISSDYHTLGTNRPFFKSIIIFLTFDWELDREVLCHELLHSIVFSAYDERYVKELGETGVCYQERWNPRR